MPTSYIKICPGCKLMLAQNFLLPHLYSASNFIRICGHLNPLSYLPPLASFLFSFPVSKMTPHMRKQRDKNREHVKRPYKSYQSRLSLNCHFLFGFFSPTCFSSLMPKEFFGPDFFVLSEVIEANFFL